MRSSLGTVALPLGATLAIQVMVSLAALAVPVLAPEIAPALGVPASWVGYHASLLYLGAVASSMGARPALARGGALSISLLCLLAIAAGLVVMTVGHIAWVGLGTVIVGLGYGLVTPASSAILARRTPPAIRNVVFSIKQTGVPLGAALAGILLPALLLISSWQATLAAVALASVLAALLMMPLRARLDEDERPRDGSGPPAASPVRLVLAHPPLCRLALGSFAFAAMQLCLGSFLVIQLVQVVRLDLVQAGAVFALAQAAGVVGRIAWGALADWLRASRATLIGLAVAMSVLALLVGQLDPGWPPALVVTLTLAFGLTASGWNGVYLAEVARLAPPGQAGSATGGALAFTYAGVVAGPPLFATVLQLTGQSFPLAYLTIAILTLAAGGLIWWRPAGAAAEAPGRPAGPE